jgi:hypothetical protein
VKDPTKEFAILAYPANYGSSGIMTFIVDQEGAIYHKNLGVDTGKAVESITSFARMTPGRARPDGTNVQRVAHRARMRKSVRTVRRTSMKSLLALAAAGFLLAACTSGPTIRANTAPGVNLQSYKTYTFAPHLGTDRGGVETPLSGYFSEAVRREVDLRGYKFVEEAMPT